MSKLDDIKARLAAITQGPWWPRFGGAPGFIYSSSAKVLIAEVVREKSKLKARPDSDFIAAAPTDLAWAVERIERLERHLMELLRTATCERIDCKRNCPFCAARVEAAKLLEG